MGTEYLDGPLGFADGGEEVPQAEHVADLMGECFDLFSAVESIHLRVNCEAVATRVGEEGTGEHAAGGVAVIGAAGDDLEVPQVVILMKLHWRRIAPGENGFAE